LLNASAVTLDSASNNVGTLAADAVGAITYVDADALTIGSVNPVGITASGAVDIATLTGDLTIAQNISGTTVRIVAGMNAAAGTSTGGNIVISGTPTITATTGNAVLYTGSIAGSTGVAESAAAAGDGLVAYGSGHFRYNADETTDFSGGNWTALGATGIHAVYREQPTISVAPGAKTITYGAGDPTSFTASYAGFANGDASDVVVGTAVWTPAALTEGTTSTGGKRIVGSYDVAYTSGLGSGIGYAFADASANTNELTVQKLALNGSITGGGNTYGSALTAGGLGFSNAVANDIVSGATVTIDTSGLLSTSANLKAGTHAGVQSVGTDLSGADAGN